MEELSTEERKFVTTYYKAKILPVLSPQIVDARHPFPHLANKALYVAGLMRSRKGAASLGFLPAPRQVQVRIPGDAQDAAALQLVLPKQGGRVVEQDRLHADEPARIARHG